jgi:class 3 adenylate cyclase
MLLSGCVGSVAIGRFEHAVLGEAVHTAAQLHTLAGPHEVLVSDAVMRGLAGRFASESLGLRPVAGGRPEISVHRVLASAPAAAKNLPREDRAAYADVSTEHAH